MAEDKLRETEVKLYTPNLAMVRMALEANGATLLKPRVFERNLRYDSADGALIASGIVLRLRQDEGVTFTYKDGGSIERGIVSRFEAEVEVSDFDTLDLILRRLGYRVALVYEKYRRTYELGGAEVVLDELPYGNFTEIEADAAMIERVVDLLGLTGARRMSASYTDIYLKLRERLDLDVEDCTFDEFAGVDLDLAELF